MPTIYDNIGMKFADGLTSHISTAKRVDYCVGYFNIRGWKTVCDEIDLLEGMDIYENNQIKRRYCRLLVGMVKTPLETIVDSLNSENSFIDNERASKVKRRLAEIIENFLSFQMEKDHTFQIEYREKCYFHCLRRIKMTSMQNCMLMKLLILLMNYFYLVIPCWIMSILKKINV